MYGTAILRVQGIDPAVTSWARQSVNAYPHPTLDGDDQGPGCTYVNYPCFAHTLSDPAIRADNPAGRVTGSQKPILPAEASTLALFVNENTCGSYDFAAEILHEIVGYNIDCANSVWGSIENDTWAKGVYAGCATQEQHADLRVAAAVYTALTATILHDPTYCIDGDELRAAFAAVNNYDVSDVTLAIRAGIYPHHFNDHTLGDPVALQVSAGLTRDETWAERNLR